MVSKIFKYDFKRLLRQMIPFILISLIGALLTRCFGDLGKSVKFFSVLNILISAVTYALMGNVIIRPIVNGLTHFCGTMYGDESYLTHTLPAKKSQVLAGKTLAALAIMGISLVVFAVSLFIILYSPQNMKNLQATIEVAFGQGISGIGMLVILVLAFLVQIVSFYFVVQCAIIFANKHNSKKVRYGFIYTAIITFVEMVLMIALVGGAIVLSGDTAMFTNADAMPSAKTFILMYLMQLVSYVISAAILYFISRRELNKGVNVN